MIGDDVVIEVVEVRGDRVRLGFTAPDYVSIVRNELLEVLKDESKRATHRGLARAS